MARNAEGWGRAIALIAFPGLLLAACASPPGGSDSYLPSSEAGNYRVGVPYQIKGVWYYPAVDYNYDRTGVASWYGEEFEGRLTANGEIFELNALTAAHTTLPMPSIVQVTNLENGRSLQLRINDRGPFVDGRLIDVSRRAAQLLGFESRGTTPVRVTILKEESIAAAEEAMHNGTPVIVAAAPAASAWARSGATYAAASEPSPIARISTAPPATRTIEQLVETAQVATARNEPRDATITQTATASAEPPTPERQSVMAVLRPTPARAAPATRYRFSLISRADAAELSSFRAFLHKPEIAALAPPAAKTPPLPLRRAASKGPARIFVQAGAFSRRDNAEKVQLHLARWGSAQVTSASINGAAMYRVRIGPLESEAQARRLLAQVVSNGYPGARIVGD
jgi:rare lipoprotein A